MRPEAGAESKSQVLRCLGVIFGALSVQGVLVDEHRFELKKSGSVPFDRHRSKGRGSMLGYKLDVFKPAFEPQYKTCNFFQQRQQVCG